MKVLVFTVLIVAALSTSSFLGSYDKLKKKLHDIDSTEFGKNLLDTIAL
jgi:hypothetical protein